MQSRTISEGAAHVSQQDRILPYDARLRREITQRRLVTSIIRRFVRVLSLHVLDGLVVVGSVMLLARLWEPFTAMIPFIPVIGLVFLLSLNALSTYRSGDARRDERRLLMSVVLALMILASFTVFPPTAPFDPLFLAALGTAAGVGLVVERNVVDQIVRQIYLRGLGLRRTLVVGNLDEAGRTIHQLRSGQQVDQYLVGHVSPESQPDPTALGTLQTIGRVISEHDVQEVVVAATLPAREMRHIAEICFENGASLYMLPSVLSALPCRAESVQVGSAALLRLHPARLELPALFVKRMFDLLAASLLLILCAPLMCLIALAIRLESRGPALYKAKRVGLGGSLFTMWKFRSMYQDSEQREDELAHMNIYSGGTFKIPNDPRTTRVGRILRRTSLDELPQLINVLRGEMSLVGPRPALVADLERYKEHHFERLTVIPGITGPWQVAGRNLITDFETVVRLERDYIHSWSLLLDWKILLRTVKVVVSGEGAF